MNHPLLAALIIAATLVADIYTDLRRWGRINHIRGAWLRVPSAIIAAIINPWSLVLWLAYWPLFDMWLAIGRRLPVLYVGETSWLDKLQQRGKWLIAVKWGLGVAAVILYLLL